MTLDDALMLAGQVLADYEASGPGAAPGEERIWPGRLAQALRDLAGASAAWYASPAGDPSAAALNAVVCRLQDDIARIETQAVRLETASSALARRSPRPQARGGWRRLMHPPAGRAAQHPGAGAVLLSPAEADTAWQAAADAAAWHADYGDCAGCVTSGACTDPARHQAIVAAYAALRIRLDGERR